MKIQKGTKNGLDFFVERTKYTNDEERKVITVFYTEFCETPSGDRCFEERKSIDVRDTPEIKSQDSDGTNPPIAYQAASTSYTDYCKQFNADLIGQAIDDYLKKI